MRYARNRSSGVFRGSQAANKRHFCRKMAKMPFVGVPRATQKAHMACSSREACWAGRGMRVQRARHVKRAVWSACVQQGGARVAEGAAMPASCKAASKCSVILAYGKRRGASGLRSRRSSAQRRCASEGAIAKRRGGFRPARTPRRRRKQS